MSTGHFKFFYKCYINLFRLPTKLSTPYITEKTLLSLLGPCFLSHILLVLSHHPVMVPTVPLSSLGTVPLSSLGTVPLSSLGTVPLSSLGTAPPTVPFLGVFPISLLVLSLYSLGILTANLVF